MIGVAALGAYGYRKYTHQSIKFAVDNLFKLENLPLYATEAFKRDKLISNVMYDLVISLSKDSDTYEGRLITKFFLNQEISPSDMDALFLDFHGKRIFDVKINGSSVSLGAIIFDKHRIFIP